MCRECFALRQHTTIQILENFKFTPTINGLSCISKLIVYLWVLQWVCATHFMCSARMNSIFKHRLKIALYKLQKHRFQLLQATGDTCGQGHWNLWVKRIHCSKTAHFTFSTYHITQTLKWVLQPSERMYTFHIICLFTFNNISKTLILCPIKEKPRTQLTNLLCTAWEILIMKRIDLAFASTVINMIRGFLHLLFFS